MDTLKEHLFHEKRKTSLLGFLKLRDVGCLDMIEDRELDLILKTMDQVEIKLSSFNNDTERIYYLKNLLRLLMASSMLQAKAMFERLEER